MLLFEAASTSCHGPTSFQHLRTVSGHVYPTYRAACYVLGLLEDDSHWNDTLSEAATTDSSTKLRYLFAIMLATCGLSNPKQLWENHKDSLSEDVHRQVQQKNPTVEINYADDIHNKALILLEDLVLSINGKSLQEFAGAAHPVRLVRRAPYHFLGIPAFPYHLICSKLNNSLIIE